MERWRDPAEKSCNTNITVRLPSKLLMVHQLFIYQAMMARSAAHLALSSVLSSMGGSVLFEGCPDDDMDLV